MYDTMYKTVRLPKKLTDEIDKIVEQRIHGYRARAEFVAEAIREKLAKLDEENGGKEQ